MQEEGKERFLGAVRALSQAFALAVPHEEAVRIRDDVGFFQQCGRRCRNGRRRKRGRIARVIAGSRRTVTNLRGSADLDTRPPMQLQ